MWTCEKDKMNVSYFGTLVAGQSLIYYWNETDGSLQQLRIAMHYHPPNKGRAIDLSILSVSKRGESSHVANPYIWH